MAWIQYIRRATLPDKPTILPILALLFLALALAWWVLSLGKPDFPLDDAYILQHSVESLLRGKELRFSEAKPLTGATSLGHVLIVALFALFLPVGWAQVTVTSIAVVAYLIGVYRLAERSGADAVSAIALGVGAVETHRAVFHLLNGLETPVALAAVTWTLVLFRSPLPKRISHFVLIGVLPFIRPELGALSGLVFIRAIWNLREQEFASVRATKVLLITASAAGVFGVVSLWMVGSPFPSTIAAKVYFFSEGCQSAAAKWNLLSHGVFEFSLSLGILGVGILGLITSPLRFLAIGFLGIYILAFFLRLPGAVFHNDFRYLALFVPFVLAGWGEWLGSNQRLVRVTGVALFSVALLHSSVAFPEEWFYYQRMVEKSRGELASVAGWVAEHIVKDAPVLVHDAGYISRFGTQPLVDVVGLKSPSSVGTHRKFTWASCGRDPRAIDIIARRGRAQYFVVLDEWDRIFQLTRSLYIMGWRLTRADSERGDSAYAVFRIESPSESYR